MIRINPQMGENIDLQMFFLEKKLVRKDDFVCLQIKSKTLKMIRKTRH